MIEYKYDSDLILYYDDGAGNEGTYNLKLQLDGAELSKMLLPETQHYRLKIFRALPPKEVSSYACTLVTTVAGAPPATLAVTVGPDGTIPLTNTNNEHVTHMAFKQRLYVEAIDNDAIFVDEAQTAIVITPKDQSNNGKLGIGFDGIDYQGDASDITLAVGYAACINWKDMSMPVAFNAVGKDIDVILWYNLSECENEEDTLPNIKHNVIAIIETDFLETDYHEGQLIERALEVVISMMGFENGKLGPAIGSFMEYQNDGQWGDLDMPIETFQRSWNASV